MSKAMAYVRRLVRWLATILVLTVLGWGALSGYAALDRPVTTVRIQGPTSAAQRAEVQAIVDTQLGRGVLSTDVHAIGEGLRKLEWTRAVSVRRVWPDRIVVELGRAIPIARWNDDRLLGEDGRSYPANAQLGSANTPIDAQRTAPDRANALPDEGSPGAAVVGAGEMPALFGPESAAREVLERYQVLRDTAASAGLSVTRAGVDAQGEWSMVLDGRITVLLGSTDMLVRTRRVIELYARHLARVGAQVAQIDARYANGVAVGWRHAPLTPPKVMGAADESAGDPALPVAHGPEALLRVSPMQIAKAELAQVR